VRRVFSLGADVTGIGAPAKDRLVAPLVARRPKLRVPGGWDCFDLAVHAILGQANAGTRQARERRSGSASDRCPHMAGASR
jgi:3-methyladenine DNA glycosylase/8-oxoguanine DNA glycosylase